MNIASVLSDRAREASERTALYFEDGRSWSWGTLDRITVTVARLLESKGITCGDRVAVAVPNRPEVVALLYGAWRMGAVPVTISSLYNREELTKTLEETRPRLVVVTPQTPTVSGWETLCLAPETMKEWESAQLEEPLADPVQMKDTDEAVVLFTGGTTGLPKPVVTTHGGTMGAVRKLAAVSKGRPGPYKLAHPDVPPNLLALPLFHSGGQQTPLFAALDVATGAVIGKRYRRHRVRELLDFLKVIDRNVPDGLDIHIVMDNYATHKTAAVKAWLALRPHWHVHCTLTSASWINQVERWFAELTRKQLQHGVHRSTRQLEADIRTFIDSHNHDPRPFKWTKSADDIPAAVKRF